MDELCEVVITAPDAEWLATFTAELVRNRLAACGHVIGPIRSIYRWQGTIHDETEARVALHTVRRHVPAIVERTDGQHPYDVPCVIATPIVDGDPLYGNWVRENT